MAEDISRQPKSQAVACLWLSPFTDIYNENSTWRGMEDEQLGEEWRMSRCKHVANESADKAPVTMEISTVHEKSSALHRKVDLTV